MFKKLLKYDMMSIWRVWWIIAVSVPGISVVGAMALRFLLSNMENDSLFFLLIGCMVMFFVSMVAVFASIALTEILVYYRFYKNFYTDEGYLTFTLPVSRKTLFLSKTVNALIWTLLHIVLLVICVLIFFLLAPPPTSGTLINTVMFEMIGQGLASAWSALGGWLIVYAFVALLILLAVLVFSVSLVHFCITVGAIIAKKAKLLAGIGIYYLVNMLLSFLSQFFGMFGLFTVMEGVMGILSTASSGERYFAVLLSLLILLLMCSAMASIMYFMTLGKLERKLNLA